MNFWYIVEEKSHYDAEQKVIGASISAEIVEVKPRHTTGNYEWHDTETIEGNVYILRRWCRTKADALSEIKFHMHAHNQVAIAQNARRPHKLAI